MTQTLGDRKTIMKPFSLSICALSGAIMAAAGTLAESAEGARATNDLDIFGMIVAGAFCLFTLVSVIRATRVEEVRGGIEK